MRPALRSWLAAGFVGIVVAGIAAAWWLARSTPEQSLAAAYSDGRTLELRIPAARYARRVAAPRTRGGGPGIQPASLLLAEGRIAREQERHPESMRWRQLRARAALLRWDFDSALAELERIRLLDRRPSAAMPDIALAYFERAEARNRPLDYAEALEYFSQELRQHPDDREALFNCGVVYWRLQLPLDAQRAWEHYLRLDPSSGWAEEVRAQLAEVRAMLRHLDEPAPASLETLLWKADYHVLDPRQARDLTAGHGDRFLEDLLVAPRPDAALVALAAAREANGRSDPDAAIPPARAAAAAFRQAGNAPAALQADLEYVYALQRALKPCRKESAGLLRDLAGKHYPWLLGQALLAGASCSTIAVDFGQSNRLAEQALGIAEGAGYSTLALRCLGILAATLSVTGRAAEAWDADQRGLRIFWSGSFPAERAYQFYYDLSQIAEAAGYGEANRAMLRQAVATISRSPNRSVEGIVRQRLSRALSLAGDLFEAEAQLKRADELFAGLKQSEAVQYYRMDGEIGLLAIEVERGHAAQALEKMRAMQASISERAGEIGVVKFHQALADAERRTGDSEAAVRDLREVVATSEKALSSLRPGQDQLAWIGLISQGYRMLVQNSLEHGDVTRALEIWEWARGSEIRHRVTGAGGPGGMEAAARVRQTSPALTDVSVLSYAQLGDRMALWLYDNRGVRFAWSKGDAAQIRLLAAQFTELCADPKSDPRVLRETGARLYDALIEPMAGWLDAKRKLVLEPDGGAALAPFEAIPVPDAGHLGEQFTIEISPGIYYRDSDPLRPATTAGRAVVVGAPALSPELVEGLPPLPEALEEARAVARHFSRPVLLTGNAATVRALGLALASAGVFHFAGHAAYTTQQSALLMAADRSLDGGQLLDAEKVSGLAMPRGSLVVLSGCSTGRMRERALTDSVSLVRAFLAAGAGTVVASRWNVDSHATERLMEAFYQSLEREPDPARSLAIAEAALRSRAETAHAYYWSAFTAFGAR